MFDLLRRKKFTVIAILLLGIFFLAGGFFLLSGRQQQPEQPQFINQASIGVWGPIRLSLPISIDTPSTVAFHIQPPLPFVDKRENGQIALWFTSPADPDIQYTLQLVSSVSIPSIPTTYEWVFTPRTPQVTYLDQGEKGAELAVVSTDLSQPTLLTRTNHSLIDYEIAPDGQELLLSILNTRNGSDIWRAARDGSDLRQLVACEDDICSGMAFLPYQEGFAFVRTLVGGPGAQIQFFDSLTQSVSTLYEHTGRPVRDLKWSPDASILAFISDETSLIHFYWRDTHIVKSIACYASETGGWSSSGNQMTFACAESPEADPCRPLKQVDVNTLEISTSPIHDILGNRDYSAPLWSDDGRWIVFGERCLGDRPTRQLWLVNADTNTGSQITDDLLYNFANYRWDPNSRMLVLQRFEMGSASASPDIMLWWLSTEQMELLTENGHSPNWLP